MQNTEILHLVVFYIWVEASVHFSPKHILLKNDCLEHKYMKRSLSFAQCCISAYSLGVYCTVKSVTG